ncbi:MAG: proton-conducting transporter membrane subunit [Nitrospirota bacterium]
MWREYYPLLIPAGPVVAALLTALPSRLIREWHYRIGTFAHTVAFGCAVVLLIQVAGSSEQTPVRLDLFPSPWRFVPSFTLAVDRLAAVLMVVISAIGALLYFYSIRYMQQERGRARYHALLSVQIAVLLGMVSSANLVMLFVFWQLLGWLLSLLSYNYAHPPTSQGAFRTFIMLRLGDIVFLSGIVLAFTLYGTVDLSQLFVRAAENQSTLTLFWPGSGLDVSGATAVTLLIFVGAMSKSAQIPLHMWLPDSLYAPTTIHALLHAGIINAGGFLLTRLAPLFVLAPTTLHVTFAVGLLTALLGASMMLTQNDIKKTLGYSTIGQMGYMIMECGLGAFSLAVFHLIAHGLFKATIFLNCGNVIHLARREPRSPHRPDARGLTSFSAIPWATGFITTLVLPLVILLAAHGVLQIPLRIGEGGVIFLFFSWVTSSQAILTLYRLRAVESWKVAGLMLVALLLVMFTYLFAAERFTRFLFPDPGVVTAYFEAAALPGPVFDALIAVTALVAAMGWILIYSRSHGRPIPFPARISALHTIGYLFLVNRLYLDGLALRLGQGFSRAIQALDHNRLFPPVAALLAAVPAIAVSAGTFPDLAGTRIALCTLTALALPLFPLHGAYVLVLTRLPGFASSAMALLLPLAGLYGAASVLPELPARVLTGVKVLALSGAVYGSIKALAQVRATGFIAYGGVALYSILWWHVAVAGRVMSQDAIFAGAAALVAAGLCLAWRALQIRYGDLTMNRIGGLARPMPRFATLLALLVMAAAGLPPFGLFSGYVALLLDPSNEVALGSSVAIGVVLLVWFIASWYLFKLMQRLLFGPHRPDLPYQDLRPVEIAPLVAVLLMLLALGVAPHTLIAEVDTLMLTAWSPR